MKRPMLKQSKSNPENYYFINSDGQRVMVPSDVVEQWDDILEVETAVVNYEQRMGDDGTLKDEPWSRVELIDYTTMTRERKLVEHTTSLNEIKQKSQLTLEKLFEKA